MILKHIQIKHTIERKYDFNEIFLLFRNVFEAIDQCQEQGGQLISVDSCNTLENINMELLLQGYSEGDEFLIGLFHFKTNEHERRLRSLETDMLVTS